MSAERRIAYINARLLDPATGLDAKGALLSVGNQIWDLGPKLFNDSVPDGVEIVDCQGHCLAPGFIDMHVHLSEPYETTGQAAAAGGVSALVLMPDMEPVLDHASLVDYVERRAQDSRVRIHAMGAATKGLAGLEMSEMRLLHRAGAVAFTDARQAIWDPVVMRRILTYTTNWDGLIVQHVEEPALAREGCMNDGETATRLGLPGIPAMAEVIMLERDLRLVAATGARYHAAQLTTRAALEVMRRAKAEGHSVTCGTAPHYFALNDLAVGDYRTFAKVSPPLREEDDRKAVVEAIADGTIDVIASAHDPHDDESKRLPFADASDGVIGLETLLPVGLELVHAGHISMLRLIGALSRRPAEILKLPGGCLAKGTPADLVLFNPDVAYRINPSQFHSKAKNSAFEDRPVQGKVLRTVVDGKTVFESAGRLGQG